MEHFSGRKLVIASMHQKEKVIAQKVASKLGVLPFVPLGLDTDQLGTFSGEIKRELDPISTARKKCDMAMDLTGVDLAIASEGSFGQHPFYSFIPANEEMLMLLDRKNGLEIVGKKLSTDTNFDGQYCIEEEELIAFARKIGFPSHALILRDTKDSNTSIFKGIIHKTDLVEKFRLLKNSCGHVFAETDMRALYNPKRMKVIGTATDELLKRACSHCEECNSPGFGITDVRTGLKCRQCGLPTRSTSAYVFTCSKCGFKKEQVNLSKLSEDPMYCDYCNP